MIRQAISCDICGAEKKQTNHWFVVYTHGGELRVSGWNAGGGRTRAGAKHLCGQTCLHKLVDEFIAGTVSSRSQSGANTREADEPASTDTSLTGACAAPAAVAASTGISGSQSRPLRVVPAAVIALAPSRPADEARSSAPLPSSDGSPGYGSRRWRAEAWERERERERCASQSAHRKSS